MSVDPDTHVPDARLIGAVWAGLLLPPIAFLINLELAYALVPAACSSRNSAPIHLVHLACLLLTLAGGLIARRTWKTVGLQWPDEEGGSLGWSRFLAGLAVLLSGTCFLVIVGQWVAVFLLDPCQ